MGTHNRAGEITYRHVSGLTYEFTITTCTKTSVIADREWLHIDWGDDLNPDIQLDSLQRDSIFFDNVDDYQINFYSGFHTYANFGSYTIHVEDPNRNEGVNNIPNSVDVVFYIESELILAPGLGENNSVQLLNSPKEEACLNEIWIHNPGAFDPDGDSLYFSLIECRRQDGLAIPGYQFPDVFTANPNDTFTIDSQTGDVVWDVASSPSGEYNIAILIEEFRFGIKVGSVVRDMQIVVNTCNNNPPEIEEILDVCVEVNEELIINVNASDPDGDNFFIEAIGAPMTETQTPATFGAQSGVFKWTPQCAEVRYEPYQMLFRAEDFGNQIPLVDIETVNITVVAPAVENPEAMPSNNSIILNWDPNPCINSFQFDPESGNYKIYRRLGEFGFEPDHCELGVPEYTGYELIGTVEGLNNTTFIDTELSFGGFYCYMVVTCLEDGSVSYASEEFCAEIIKTVPVMTHVDVEITDPTNGENFIEWSPPSAMDTLVAFPPPYFYELYFSPGYGQPSQLIYTSPENNILMFTDTNFVHTGIDTELTANSYEVWVYSDGNFVTESTQATSLFLSVEGDDNSIILNWIEEVPWFNELYEVYRFDDDLGSFELIGTTTDLFYVDEGLQNTVEYCYYVRSMGTFNEQNIENPLYNKSQRVCGIPYDFTAPCPPVLSVNADCELEVAELTWSNPNNDCADDVVEYALYYSPVEGEPLEVIEVFTSDNDTMFTYNLFGEAGSIAGCYAVTALDSLLPGPGGLPSRNESEFSEILCVDNCPLYFLPNVFTPNNDGMNDFFHPLPYKFVESIDLKIYNRWGTLVFETLDPDINWDGTNKDSGEISSDGTYYYVATVNTIRLSGIVPINLTGNITLLGGDPTNKSSD